MPFSSVETVTVSSGQPLVLPDGTWQQGRIIFTGPDLVTIGGQDVTLGGGVEVALVDGAFSVDLVATDATGMSPTGWTYTVTAMLTNAPDWIRYITLPKASSSVVLADIVVPDPVAGTYTVLVDPSSIAGSTPASTVVTETAYGQASAVGTGTAFARADHTHGTPAAPTTGTTAGTYAAGNDARLSDARTPTAHASTHASAGTDPVTPAAIGALATSGGTLTGALRSTSAVLGQVHPSRHGFKAWAWPPTEASTAATATSGTLFLAALDPAESFTSAFLHWHVSVTGVTATGGQNFVGLYASDGTLLASAGVDADVTSAAGARKTALVAALTAGSSYWAAFLFNAATAPQLARGGIATAASSLTNINLSAANMRFATNGTSRTALPSPLVPASNIAGSAFFAAIE